MGLWTSIASEESSGFARAVEPRVFRFPEDHGSHPEFKLEWWYFTGTLETESGEALGYQATWFRKALVFEKPERRSALAARDFFHFHGALSDIAGEKYVFDKASCRGATNWAGADEGKPRVFLLGRALEQEADGAWRLKFTLKGRAFDLRLVHEREPLLHGEKPGLSQKGARPGQASYYVSIPRLRTEGTIQREPSAAPVKVRGLSWFDHEFGSDSLGEGQTGWDWFSVSLDDGSDLMLYVLRSKDGRAEPTSSGTLRLPGGKRVHLKREDFAIEVLGRWKSEATGAEYPARWRVRVPAHGIDLEVRPLLADQELRTSDKRGITYWEGLCRFEGRSGGREVKGRGYVELVGYASGSLEGL